MVHSCVCVRVCRVCVMSECATSGIHLNVRTNSFLSRFRISEFQILPGAETAASQQEVDRHLELGKQFLVNGQLSDALTHYHAAVGEYIKLCQRCVQKCRNQLETDVSFFILFDFLHLRAAHLPQRVIQTII